MFCFYWDIIDIWRELHIWMISFKARKRPSVSIVALVWAFRVCVGAHFLSQILMILDSVSFIFPKQGWELWLPASTQSHLPLTHFQSDQGSLPSPSMSTLWPHSLHLLFWFIQYAQQWPCNLTYSSGGKLKLWMFKNMVYCKSKLQWGITSHQSEWPSSKNLQTINAGEGVGKREPSCTAGGNVN